MADLKFAHGEAFLVKLMGRVYMGNHDFWQYDTPNMTGFFFIFRVDVIKHFLDEIGTKRLRTFFFFSTIAIK